MDCSLFGYFSASLAIGRRWPRNDGGGTSVGPFTQRSARTTAQRGRGDGMAIECLL